MKNVIEAILNGFRQGGAGVEVVDGREVIISANAIALVVSAGETSPTKAQKVVKSLEKVIRVEGYAWNTGFVYVEELMAVLFPETEEEEHGSDEAEEKEEEVVEESPILLLPAPKYVPLKRGALKRFRTLEELKREYRRLMKIYHPDHGGRVEDFESLRRQYRAGKSDILFEEEYGYEEN